MNLSDDTLLNQVWAPVVTGKPLSSPHHDMMMLPDGEIRHYGAIIRDFTDFSFDFVVQKSHDYGMSWSTCPVRNRTPGATVRSPWSGDWLSVLYYTMPPEHLTHFPCETYQPILKECNVEGVWLFRSGNGPDGDFTMKRIFPDPIFIQRLPLPLRNIERWIIPGQEEIDGFLHPVVLLSDDDGESWRKVVLPYPPLHKIEWPHRGYRWRQPGTEPVVAEYPSGRIQMLLRTSQDTHYQCFSEDGGESWSTPEPSPFYSVATMPNLMSISDGRMLAIWNNTTPLPECDHALQTPELDAGEINGRSEDVFTNRDVLHAAISDDQGQTWRGFRELVLNPLRNAGDFRTVGGKMMFDRSVHQTQALELPGNKILVGYGQHVMCWGFLVFDLGFLLETSRSDDFSDGLQDWSVHQYLKSHSGNFRCAGHCAWNRRAGASLIPAPDGSPREVLQIARHPDPRLVFEREGAVWNFPAAVKGRVTLELMLVPGSGGLRITLCDRWFNPVDPVVHQLSPFVFELDSAGRINQVPCLKPGMKSTLEITFDHEAGTASFSVVGITGETTRQTDVSGDISYLHLQSLAEGSDPHGVLIYSVAMQAV